MQQEDLSGAVVLSQVYRRLEVESLPRRGELQGASKALVLT